MKKKIKILDTNEKVHYYLAIDSCVLINLASILKKMEHQECKYFLNDEKELRILFDAIADDKVRIFIPDMVYMEVVDKEILNMEKCCYFDPKTNSTTYYIIEFLKKYCYFSKDSNTNEYVNLAEYITFEYLNSRALSIYDCYDALIMAQTSVERLNLLTQNECDFISVKNIEYSDNIYRKKDIRKINFLNSSKFKKDSNNISEPITLKELVSNGRIDLNKCVFSSNDSKIRYEKFISRNRSKTNDLTKE